MKLFQDEIIDEICCSWSRTIRPFRYFQTLLQHLFRSRYFSLTSGAGYAHTTGVIRPKLFIVAFDFTEEFPTADTEIKHGNIYAYANINVIRNLTFILGGSLDHMQGSDDVVPDGSTIQFNPKAGIIWRAVTDILTRSI